MQHISVTLTYSSTSAKYFLYILSKIRCSRLMLILLCLPAHITTHRRCMLDRSLWCRCCNKIKCHRTKNGERILTMFSLPDSKAIVTELFTVADFHSAAWFMLWKSDVRRWNFVAGGWSCILYHWHWGTCLSCWCCWLILSAEPVIWSTYTNLSLAS